MTIIAFQGEDGAYSQEAIFETFGARTSTLPCATFVELFRAVETGAADLGMLPIENSTAGAINQSYDLLLEHDLKITREVIFRVRHALMAAPGAMMTEIKRVYSHPQALAQCERFIAERGWEPVVAYDTAGAAKQLAASREKDAGAIASETAARLYDLQVLARGVEDLTNNFTRFFVVGHAESPRAERSKTSIVLATRHIPGSLYACLGEFASRDLNLTKLESRPDRQHPWHYVFYLDFEGHRDDAACRDALNGLLDKTSFVKTLGSYPAAAIPEPGVE
jgi:prephenate dehydratase